MIKAKKGNIKFNGLSVELMAEYTGITRGLIQALIEKKVVPEKKPWKPLRKLTELEA